MKETKCERGKTGREKKKHTSESFTKPKTLKNFCVKIKDNSSYKEDRRRGGDR